MPGGDGTGPAGMGPMTGRAAGMCAGYPMPGFMNPMGGRGRGFWGGGRGRGWRHRFWATGLPGWARAGSGGPAYGVGAYPYPPTGWPPQANPPAGAEQELEALKGQAEYFQGALEEIQHRIDELGKKGEGD